LQCFQHAQLSSVGADDPHLRNADLLVDAIVLVDGWQAPGCVLKVRGLWSRWVWPRPSTPYELWSMHRRVQGSQRGQENGKYRNGELRNAHSATSSPACGLAAA
jgi:hypothetical protein